MAFAVSPAGIGADEAKQRFNSAIQYLRQSDMASSIIDELSALTAVITVRIGPGLVDKYIHPKPDDKVTGGIIEWDPDLDLDVVDKAKYRPKVSWVKDKTKRHGFLWMKSTRVNAVGTISANVALLHEMGHAYQFFGDKDGYREAMKDIAKPQEDHVVAAIENTVVLELRQRGQKEGIRWGYLDNL